MTESLRTKLLDRFFVLIDVKYVFFSTHYPNKLLLETQGKFFSSQIFENVVIGFNKSPPHPRAIILLLCFG